MRWYDYVGMLSATILALFAERAATRSYQAAILTFLSARSGQGWMRLIELRKIFGWNVSSAMRSLHARGLVVREVSNDPITDAARGGRPDTRYRSKTL